MKNLTLLVLLSTLTLFVSCESDDYAIDSNDDTRNSADFFGNSETGSLSPTPTGDNYDDIVENPFIKVSDEATSTFSIDADGASYANVRRYLESDQALPPAGAIRTEEFINYFDLKYPFEPVGDHPISLNGEVSDCPWADGHKLVRIGIEGEPLPSNIKPASNFVFLIDVSGSMAGEDRLELLKTGFNAVVDQMTADDRVAIVTYGSSSELALSSTPGDQKETIKNAITALGSGGSTAGAEGIMTAYQIAQENLIEGGNNRIIVGTDGAFNVGISDHDSLVALIENKRDFGIYLTVVGVGRGNYNDATLEQIANHGNGTFEYADKPAQIKKVFLHEYNKFFSVAKDVKVQVTFNNDVVDRYRLIGYENRVLENEDFEDDEKDAGEIGADQNITALYEIIPTSGISPLNTPAFEIDFRYKRPDEDTSIPITLEVFDTNTDFASATDWMQFTAGVAAFGLVLRDSEYKGEATYESILNWLNMTDLEDEYGWMAELKTLVETAEDLE